MAGDSKILVSLDYGPWAQGNPYVHLISGTPWSACKGIMQLWFGHQKGGVYTERDSCTNLEMSFYNLL